MYTLKAKRYLIFPCLALLICWSLLSGCIQTEVAENSKTIQSEVQTASTTLEGWGMASEAGSSASAHSSGCLADLDNSISAAILAKWGAQSQQEAFYTEAHLVLDTREEKEETVVYLLEQFYRFRFENERLVVESSHSNPAVMVFARCEDGTFTLLNYYAPIEQSLEKEFSQTAVQKLKALTEEQLKPLQEKVKLDAVNYLKSVGYVDTVLDL